MFTYLIVLVIFTLANCFFLSAVSFRCDTHICAVENVSIFVRVERTNDIKNYI